MEMRTLSWVSSALEEEGDRSLLHNFMCLLIRLCAPITYQDPTTHPKKQHGQCGSCCLRITMPWKVGTE